SSPPMTPTQERRCGASNVARDTMPRPSPTLSMASSISPYVWAGEGGQPDSPATALPGCATRVAVTRCSCSRCLRRRMTRRKIKPPRRQERQERQDKKERKPSKEKEIWICGGDYVFCLFSLSCLGVLGVLAV